MNEHRENDIPERAAWITAERLTELHRAATVEYEIAYDAVHGNLRDVDWDGMMEVLKSTQKLSVYETQVLVSVFQSFNAGMFNPGGFEKD